MHKLSCIVTSASLDTISADLYVVFCSEGRSQVPSFIQALLPCSEEHDLLQEDLFLTGCKNGKLIHCALLNIASFSSFAEVEAREFFRSSIGKIIRYAERNKLNHIAFSLPHHSSLSVESLLEDTITTSHLARYHFDDFITHSKRRVFGAETLTITGIPETEQTNHALEKANAIAQALTIARHWGDLPPSLLYPATFAESVQKCLHPYPHLSLKIFEKKELEELKMGGILNVCRGSMHDPRMVIVEYKTEIPNAPTLALVGKGVTFDTGGISIKPSDNMEDMKCDMGGAAAVLATMQVVGALRPAINVIACAPMVENMPSGSAVKPGDIITFYNGKTAEVKNTDAEGRLILADALSYISKHYKVDLIIDAATLTGACSVALGPLFAGLMSQHPHHAHQVLQAGRVSGDRAWELPLHNDYRKAIDSDVADICNIGRRGYKAGTITAGWFLKEFVPQNIPWIHLDIAGVAMNVPDKTYYRSYGATGFGVRLFSEFILNKQYHSCLTKNI